ncbi:hypothetical protein niasHS_000838 [Heterodera schachtii]|uniref:C2H2-type domain-containing protein n=1 Tax=Heterodera schachtii TaxID=97005 RepID=A0ABD2KLM2_HETSC
MMQQNAFATDLRLRCNHPDCLRNYVLDMVGSLRSHVSSHHGAGHNRHTNRKPNAPGLVLVLSKTDPNPAGVIAGAGRTAVYTVYRCRRVGARPLTVTFPHDNDARMRYALAVRPRLRTVRQRSHSVCRCVSDDQPPLPVRHCGLRERRRLHRPPLRRRFPGGEGARAAGFTRLVLATQGREIWEALLAADTDGLTAVFVGTGRQLLAEMFRRLPGEEQ